MDEVTPELPVPMRPEDKVIGHPYGPRALDHPRTRFNEEAQAHFLERFAETGRHEESALYAGVSYETMRAWRKTHPDFASKFQAAERVYKEKLRREIERRGVEGWLEPVYSQGQRALEPVVDAEGFVQYDGEGRVVQRPASVRKFSDRLLELLAKRQDPEFRERSEISVGAPSEATLELASSAAVRRELGKLSDEGRAHLRHVLSEWTASTEREIPSSTSTSTVGGASTSTVDAEVVEPVSAPT